MSGPNRLLKFQGPEFWQTIAGPDENPYPLEETNPSVYYSRKLSGVGYDETVGNINLDFEVAEDRDGEEIRKHVYNMCKQNYIEQGKIMMVWKNREGQLFTIDPATPAVDFVIVCHKPCTTIKGYGNITCLNKETGVPRWTYYFEGTTQGNAAGGAVEQFFARPCAAKITPEGDVYVAYDYAPCWVGHDNTGGLIKLSSTGELIWEVRSGPQKTGGLSNTDKQTHVVSLDGTRIIYCTYRNTSGYYGFEVDRDGNQIPLLSFSASGSDGISRMKMTSGGSLLTVRASGGSLRSSAFLHFPTNYQTDTLALVNGCKDITKSFTMVQNTNFPSPGPFQPCHYFDPSSSYVSGTWPKYMCTIDPNINTVISAKHICEQYPEEYILTPGSYVKSWTSRDIPQLPQICGTSDTDYVADRVGQMTVGEYLSTGFSAIFQRVLDSYTILALNKFGTSAKFGIKANYSFIDPVGLLRAVVDLDADDDACYVGSTRLQTGIGVLGGSVRRHSGSDGAVMWTTDFEENVISVDIQGGE